MGLFGAIFNFLIFGSLIYSIVLSISEAKKSQFRKQKRLNSPSSKREEDMLGKASVEKKWVSRSEYARNHQNRNRKIETVQDRPLNYEGNVQEPPSSIQSVPGEMNIQEKILSKTEKKNLSAYSLKRRPKKKLASTFLNRQTIAQAMVAKEILDKPLSIRNKRQ